MKYLRLEFIFLDITVVGALLLATILIVLARP